MVLADVNVLVSAYRADASDHGACRKWLDRIVSGAEAFAVSDSILSGFLRIVTHRRVFALPSPLNDAFCFADALRSQPHAVFIRPGDRHWEIFRSLCMQAGAAGNIVPDAWLAALAIEHGCEFVTLDRDFSRFHGLRWSVPAG